MAIINRPDYSFKGDVPTASIIQAYQQKALAEQASAERAAAAKEQKWIDVASMVNAGAGMIQKFTEQAKAKQMDDAFKAATNLLGQGNTISSRKWVTTGASQRTMEDGTVVPFEQGEYQDTLYKDTPEYKALMESYMAKAAPEDYKKAKIKSMLESQNPQLNQTAEARKTGIRDMLVTLPDGSQANKMIGFDANGAYNPLDGSRVVSPADYERLPERSYAMADVEDSEGNVMFVPKSRSGKVGTAGSAVPEKEKGKITDVFQLPKKQAADANARLKDAMEDPVIKNAKNTTVTISNVEKLLESNNKVAIDRLGGLTQKLVALDSGNLAQWEQRDPNARDYISRIHQFYTMSTKGELSPKAKKELQDLLKITKENLLMNMEDAAEQRVSALVETYPRLNKDAMKKKLGVEVYKKRLSPPESAGFSIDQDALAAELKRRGL